MIMQRLGELTVRRRRAILYASAALLVVSGALGVGVIDKLSSGGFEDPNSESAHAAAYLKSAFREGDVDLVLLVTARSGDVDDPAATAAGTALTAELAAEPEVAEVSSYWSLGKLAPLRGQDGDSAVVLARFDGTRDEVTRILQDVIPRYNRSGDVIDVAVTGYGAIFNEVSHQIERDLRRVEMIVVPLTGLLLLFVFRSAIASMLPLAVGGLAMAGTMLILRSIASVTEVSLFALNMTMAMSLGLGIDYSLFVVSRFREELAAGRPPDEAVVRTVATAGRTIAFSAVTVAASLVALLVFPLAFLRSFGFAGIAIVTIAGLASVVTLPAVLATIGPRIDRWTIRRRPVPVPGEGVWHRVAMFVMRRPVPIATVATALLLLLGVPFLRMEVGMPDPRVLPPGSPARDIVAEFEGDFAGNEAFPTFVLARGLATTPDRQTVGGYASAISLVAGVARVDSSAGSYAQGARLFAEEAFSARFERPDATYLRVVPAPGIMPFTPRAQELVADIRAVRSPVGDVELAGQTAGFVDARAELFGRLPLALGIIALATFVVLFFAFGSLLVPLKAIVLNLLSLTATFGAMVWVFQDGNLSGLLGFTPREAVDVFNPILMFAIAFGLSMDYEVFMLSRVREEYDRTGDNTAAVAMGLERTGRLVTAAALLLAVVFLAQVSSGISIIKMFGLGLTLAIVMDAFVVRATLVPALMRLAGQANWWLPAPLARFYGRYGFRESAPPESEPVLVGAHASRAAGGTDRPNGAEGSR